MGRVVGIRAVAVSPDVIANCFREHTLHRAFFVDHGIPEDAVLVDLGFHQLRGGRNVAKFVFASPSWPEGFEWVEDVQLREVS